MNLPILSQCQFTDALPPHTLELPNYRLTNNFVLSFVFFYMYLAINLKPHLFIIFVNDSCLTFGTFLQVALRWRIEKEVIDGKGKKLNLNHNH